MYTIEELQKTFLIHEKKSKEMNEKMLKEHKENYPDEPIPDFYLEEFSLPAAMASICSEILSLKNNCK